MDELINKAKSLIQGDRQEQYGSPVNNFATIAEFWSTYLRGKYKFQGELNSDDICQMMMLLKQSRLMNNANHTDSKVDIMGYLLIQEGINKGEFK